MESVKKPMAATLSSPGRLREFDVLKGIGILLVLIGHAGLNESQKMLIYGFHMPLFFFVSGCFFKPRPFGEFLRRDVRQLLVPWLTFVCFLFLSYYILGIYVSRSLRPSWLIELNVLDEHCMCLYHNIWFLVCLFLTRLLFWALYKLSDGRMLKILTGGVILYLLGYVLQQKNVNIPFFADTACSMTLFYALGYAFKCYGLHEKLRTWWAALLPLAAYVAVGLLLHPHVAIKDNVFPWYIIFYSLLGILSCYALSALLLKGRVPGTRFVERCGVISLSLLGFHGPVFLFLMPALNKLSFPLWLNVVLLLGISIPLIFVLERFFERYAPALIGKTKKR